MVDARPQTRDRGIRDPEIEDQASLTSWLSEQSGELAAAIAVRAALRVSPLIIYLTKTKSDAESVRRLIEASSWIFRANAVSWTIAKYPKLLRELRTACDAALAAVEASDYLREILLPVPELSQSLVRIDPGPADGLAGVAAGTAGIAAHAAILASRSTDMRNVNAHIENMPLVSTLPVKGAGNAAAAAATGASAASYSGEVDSTHKARRIAWEEVGADIHVFQRSSVNNLLDLPLWSTGVPRWVADAWADLRVALPKGDNWEVWTDWYEERLRGGSRGAAYEFVFASVPQEEWDKGLAEANAWIKAHLPFGKNDDFREKGIVSSSKRRCMRFDSKMNASRSRLKTRSRKIEKRREISSMNRGARRWSSASG